MILGMKKSHKVLFTITVILMLAFLGSCSWVYYDFKEGTIPSYIYPIQLKAGDLIQAQLSWPGTEDLDLYLYIDGTDLLSRAAYVDREYSSNLNPEILVFTILTDGLYYVRPDLYGPNPTAYFLTIKVNGQQVGQFYDTLMKADSGITAVQVNVQGTCTLRVTYQGPAATLYFYAPGASVLNPAGAYAVQTGTTNTLTVTPNIMGNWYLSIDHGVTSTLVLLDFNLTIQTDPNSPCMSFCQSFNHATAMVPGQDDQCICQIPFVWETTTPSCELDCSLISLTVGQINDTDCQCNPGYQFLPVQLQCQSLCNSISVWNITDSTCWVDCVNLIANSSSNINNSHCLCDQSLSWNPSSSKCEDTCKLQYPGMRHIQWNFTSDQCQIQCDQIQNAKRIEQQVMQCSCSSKRQWLSSSQSCQLPDYTFYIIFGLVSCFLLTCLCFSIIHFKMRKQKRITDQTVDENTVSQEQIEQPPQNQSRYEINFQ